MSRIIAAAVLLVLLLGLCFTNFFVVKGAYDNISSALSECETAEANKETALEGLTLEWSNKEKILGFFVNHADLEEIGAAIKELPFLSGEDFLSKCALIRFKLRKIKGEAGINAETVF